MVEPTTLALQVTGGFITGALIGYALRKAAKLVLIAVAFMLLPVFVLWYLGVLNVNWTAVEQLVGSFAAWLGTNISDMTLTLANTGAFGLSTIIGFVFGVAGFRHTIFPPVQRKYRFVRRDKP